VASLHKIKQHGRDVWRISFYCRQGEKKVRRMIRIGEMKKTTAEGIARRTQDLADLTFAGLSPDSELQAWLAKCSPTLLDKLARAGLVPRREPVSKVEPVVLGSFLDAYIRGRSDLKTQTANNLGQAKAYLIQFFGADRTMASITAGDADDWRRWMSRAKPNGLGLGPNTIRRHCGRAKQFFRAAVRRKLISENPFADMRDCEVKANRERDYFVTREEAAKVLEACPDAEWQLIFALARYGGLRTPSELLSLKWDDIDWERNRFTVRSSKTEHHEAGGIRIVPMFPEIRPYLDACYFAAAEGAENVIVRYRDRNSNLRTQLERIIKRAGLKPWPKLFQNLRASRATELAKIHPAHVAAEWLGHSRAIAAEHYWRVTDEDYERAAAVEGGARGGATGDSVDTTQDSTATDTNSGNPGESRPLAEAVEVGGIGKAPRTGFEPVTPGLGNRCSIL
jgi:integrase